MQILTTLAGALALLGAVDAQPAANTCVCDPALHIQPPCAGTPGGTPVAGLCEPGWMNNNAGGPCDMQCTSSIDCSGHGVCDYATWTADKTKKCLCTINAGDTVSNYAGDKCNMCNAAKVPAITGYPNCNTPKCDAFSTCTSRGTCTAEVVACGPNNSCNPATQQCCTWQSSGAWLTNGPAVPWPAAPWPTDPTQLKTWYPPGFQNQYCVASNEVCCGPTAGSRCSGVTEVCDDPERGYCKQKIEDVEQCVAKYTNGTTRTNPAGGYPRGCMPYQTCCDGACCNSDQSCTEAPEPQNGWKTLTGAPLDYIPSYCSRNTLVPASVIRVVILPASLTVAVLIATALVFSNVGMATPSMAIPSLLSICFCIFLLFQPSWGYSLALVLGNYFALGTTKATHPQRFTYCLVVVVLTFAIFTGGMGIGTMFVNSNGMFPSGSGTAGAPYTNLNQWQTNCAAYYNYFWADSAGTVPAGLVPWDKDPTENFTGYCAYGWLTYVQFACTMAMTLNFLLIVTTGLAMLEASPASDLHKLQGQI